MSTKAGARDPNWAQVAKELESRLLAKPGGWAAQAEHGRTRAYLTLLGRRLGARLIAPGGRPGAGRGSEAVIMMLAQQLAAELDRPTPGKPAALSQDQKASLLAAVTRSF